MTDKRTELVSVVIPAYNAAGTILETLQSVMAQDYASLEIIIVDDGSTDATAEIAASFPAVHPIRVVKQVNGGVASARNRGLAEARGQYIAILDADDIWHPSKISKQVAAFRKSGPTTALVYCFSRAIQPDGRIFFSPTTRSRSGDVYAALIMNNFVANGSAPLIRRDVLLGMGGFDESLHARGAQGCEDLEAYLRIARSHDFACVDEFLVGYRVAPDNMSSDFDRMLRSWDLVMDAEWRLYPTLDPKTRRFGRGTILRWLAMSARRKGYLARAARLLVRALWDDPAGTTCYLVTRAGYWLSGKIGVRSRLPVPASQERERGESFYSVASERQAVPSEICDRIADAVIRRTRRPNASPFPGAEAESL